jgi:hypothetical protein
MTIGKGKRDPNQLAKWIVDRSALHRIADEGESLQVYTLSLP